MPASSTKEHSVPHDKYHGPALSQRRGQEQQRRQQRQEPRNRWHLPRLSNKQQQRQQLLSDNTSLLLSAHRDHDAFHVPASTSKRHRADNPH